MQDSRFPELDFCFYYLSPASLRCQAAPAPLQVFALSHSEECFVLIPAVVPGNRLPLHASMQDSRFPELDLNSIKTPPGRRCFEEAGCVMAHPVFWHAGGVLPAA